MKRQSIRLVSLGIMIGIVLTLLVVFINDWLLVSSEPSNLEQIDQSQMNESMDESTNQVQSASGEADWVLAD